MTTATTKVLIAEDEAEARLILSKYLSSKGYQIVEAADGYEALAAFDREQPEAILLDLMMPKLDGWEVLSYVRAQSSIPILVIRSSCVSSQSTTGAT